jgi:hypothetical protein
MRTAHIVIGSLFVVGLTAAGCVKKTTSPPPGSPYINLDTARGIVGSPDRSPDDRALDAGRHPDQLLTFIGVAPGMRVAEVGAGLGYTTELLARAVGPSGVVYAQNNKFIREKFAEKPWTDRLAKPVMKPVVRVDREFDHPLPPEATNLDAVVNVMLYHDTVWMKTDRAAMNRAVFAALRPGGEKPGGPDKPGGGDPRARAADPAPHRGKDGARGDRVRRLQARRRCRLPPQPRRHPRLERSPHGRRAARHERSLRCLCGRADGSPTRSARSARPNE